MMNEKSEPTLSDLNGVLFQLRQEFGACLMMIVAGQGDPVEYFEKMLELAMGIANVQLHIRALQ